ncbi:hypothetical protein V6L77_09605 [Pannonibacter sp. Pt2-lr]
MQESIVIIGAGQAGAQVAQSLRQGGFAGAIHLLGEEPHPPISARRCPRNSCPARLMPKACGCARRPSTKRRTSV